MAEFRMPSLGADMEAGTLVEWKVKPGDEVKRGDIVAVVETQKGAIEIEIFEPGHIAELKVQPGEQVPVGSVLATLDGPSAVASATPSVSPRLGEAVAASPTPAAAPTLVRAIPQYGQSLPAPAQAGRGPQPTGAEAAPAPGGDAAEVAAARGGEAQRRHEERAAGKAERRTGFGAGPLESGAPGREITPPATGALRARPEQSARVATSAAGEQSSLAGGEAPSAPAPAARLRASPGARAAAAKLGIALEQVTGTGPGGAITREDVERFAQRGARPSGMRQAIAAAMARSKREIPHYYLSARIDLSRTMEWLRAHNQALAPTERLLPVAPLLKATALALRKVPELNGYFRDGAFYPSAAIHLGVAISLREGGLIAPALHDGVDKSLPQLMSELSDLIERTRRGQLRSSELADATVTVTSLGERGVEAVFGVIFPPQVALVGFGRVADQPWAIDGRCEARPTVIATLAADHRVSDGHRGGLFLAEVDRLLQNPEAL